ncbi:CDP-diacylglycerol--glycerol-3-phosphate 3-phosphatidyltransferase [compost metagenome]
MKKMIPSALTLANLLLGFLSILCSFRLELVPAMLLILLGMLCDFFDGFCARKLNAASELGKELDSLADLVTFGIAPATFMYITSVHEIRVLGATCCLAYVCCSALRLARFNVRQSHMTGFVGMPTPLAAVLVLVIAALLPQPAAAIGMLVIGALMVSRLSFPSLKKMKPEVAEEY